MYYVIHVCVYIHKYIGFPGHSVVKNPPANAGYPGLIPGSGRSPGEGNGNLLQYSCLENPVDRGTWWATVHRVAKIWIWLSSWACTHIYIYIDILIYSLFHILFHCGLLQDIEYSFLCYTIGTFWLSFLYILVVFVNPSGHRFGWTPGGGDGQGGLAWCGSWSCKESDTTEWLNWTESQTPSPTSFPLW